MNQFSSISSYNSDTDRQKKWYMHTVALVFTERFCDFFVNQGKKPFCGGEESLPAD